MSKTVLILAAHPDDEILGCGGVMAKYSKQGYEIHVGIVTDGSSTQYAGNESLALQKIRECEEANAMLGVKKVHYLNLPDMRLDTLAHVEINKKIEELVNLLKPHIIFTHAADDINMDHREVFKSTMVATRPGRPHLERVYTYEVPSSSEWNVNQPFIPNVFIDISSSIKKKVEAFSVYKSEIREYPHPRSGEGIEAYSKYRGIASGMKYAEAFNLIKEYIYE